LFSQISEEIEKTIVQAIKIQDNLNRDEIALGVIKRELQECLDAPLLEDCPESFGNEVLENFLSKHPDTIARIRKGPLALYSLPKEVDDYLIQILENLACRDKFIIPSGIVIAGFGYNEVFPSYMDITMEGVFNDKLKYKKKQFY
jgi:hypothetical protein